MQNRPCNLCTFLILRNIKESCVSCKYTQLHSWGITCVMYFVSLCSMFHSWVFFTCVLVWPISQQKHFKHFRVQTYVFQFFPIHTMNCRHCYTTIRVIWYLDHEIIEKGIYQLQYIANIFAQIMSKEMYYTKKPFGANADYDALPS